MRVFSNTKCLSCARPDTNPEYALSDFRLACTAVPGYDRTSQVKVSHFEVRLRPDTNPEYALSDFHFEVRLRPDTNPEYAIHLACTAVPGSDRTSQVKVSHFEVRLRPDTNPEYAISDFHLACTAVPGSDRTSQVKVSHFEVRLRPDTNPEYAPPSVKVSHYFKLKTVVRFFFGCRFLGVCKPSGTARF